MSMRGSPASRWQSRLAVQSRPEEMQYSPDPFLSPAHRSGRLVVGALFCSAVQMSVAKSIHFHVAELMRESIDPAVGRYVQMLWRGDYGGKMPETLHRWLWACEQRFPIIAAKRM